MSVKIYTNESVPVAVAAGLRRRGVESSSARDSDKLGLTDTEQLEYVASQQMAIFTHDDDSLRIAHYIAELGEEHWGIIYAHQDRLRVWSVYESSKRVQPFSPFGSSTA